MPRARTKVPIGSRFGFLAVVRELAPEPQPRGGGTRRRFVVACDCGQVVIARYWNLRSGNTRSCGRRDGCLFAHTIYLLNRTADPERRPAHGYES